MKNGESSYRRLPTADEEAFDEILKEFRPRLIFFINRYTHDLAAAEDIAIDVFVYILSYPNRYNQKTALSTYLFMLARSRAIDYLRHKKVMNETELSEAEPLRDERDPFSTLLENERKRRLSQALSELPSDMQSVIHLVYFEELSYSDAARVMKKNKKQVDNLLYRAKTLLREKLLEEADWLL